MAGALRPIRVFVLTVVLAATGAPAAQAAFPYRPGPDPSDYSQYRLPPGPGQAPNDLGGKLEWMYAATPEEGNPVNSDPRELGGVRGAHVVDNADVDTAWRTTTGRPDVTIAVLDSGIMWNNAGAMEDLRRKTRISRGEAPKPQVDRSTSLEGGGCGGFTAGSYDANGDGVFNVVDYACDSRVERDPAQRAAKGQPRGVGPANVLDPQDVLIAFTDDDDDDGNGFKDDLVGWDFLDDDNDPYDDVQYGHGTGEARDSVGEANNGGDLGTCPNCMAIHMRVGDSFIADENRFAQATIYAADNDVEVVQEALGTLNHTRLARQAVEYAYDHGVTVIASAADEAAQHHNWPSSNPHVVMVNSVTKYDEFTQVPSSYLQFNGCTNFYSKLTVAIPSVSCSSDATGRGSGMAGLIYSAALNAAERAGSDRLDPHSTCKQTDGSPCLVTANEVRQLMASGTVAGRQQADDVNFATTERSCSPPTPECTDPNLNSVNPTREVLPFPATLRYPARMGHDMFYGWGRVNMNRAVDATAPDGAAPTIPPEVEITAPEWYHQVDPRSTAFEVQGDVFARGRPFSCRVYVAPGSQPNNAPYPAGDFKPVRSPVCDGTERSGDVSGPLATIGLRGLKDRFSPASVGNFRGREPGRLGQSSNGRPNSEPYGFTIKVVATSGSGARKVTAEDRRNLYLHRDRDMLDGFPKQLPSDGESSPLFVDLDGDNRNELVIATADGIVHAYRRDGTELPGWPVQGDMPPLHTGGRAFQSGAVTSDVGAPFLGSPAAGDLDRDGSPEIVAADFEGQVYVWNADGERVLTRSTNPDWSGRPLQPFVDVRKGPQNRTQRGFIASPVLADLDGNDGGRLEIVAAAMDRHVYAWNHSGSPVDGFPTIVVDRTKVASIDPQTHAVTFNSNAGEPLDQGAIIDTPAVGDIAGDERPEIVVGTNEEYDADAPGEGGVNAGLLNTASLAILGQTGQLSLGNSRLYAIRPDGDPDSDLLSGPSPFQSGWPVKIGVLNTELLPVVGEGMTGAPIIGSVPCGSSEPGTRVGAMPAAGVGYLLNPDGNSCLGKDPRGKDIALQTDVPGNATQDTPAFPAVGHPAFGRFAGGTSFLAPAAGLRRALDLAVNEYQAGSQDFVAAWNTENGQFRPGFPSRVNDLQFLTGPSVADIDNQSGEEAVAGTASLDLAAINGNGAPVNEKWPKLTSDWTVANPLIGSFGVWETDTGARKSVVSLTRSGSVFAYRVPARACTPGSWPRFHHDNANSGDMRRDAAAPGAPTGLALDSGQLRFDAPGDDLLCGRVAGYEVFDSPDEITPANLGGARRLDVEATTVDPGERQAIDLPSGHDRWVAVRAIDEQGNVGRLVAVEGP